MILYNVPDDFEYKMNDYLHQFGLVREGDRLVGRTRTETLRYLNIDEYDGFESVCGRLVVAKYHLPDKRGLLAMYVGNLSNVAINELKKFGLTVTEHGVWVLEHNDFNTFHKLIDILCEAKHISPIILKMLRAWPETDIILDVHTHDTPTFKEGFRFEYSEGAGLYHTTLPIPFSDIETSVLKAPVLVEVKTNDCGLYKYVIKIANHKDIITDTIPKPSDLKGLIIKSQSPWYGIVKFLKGIIC